MSRITSLVLAALLALTACGDDEAATTTTPADGDRSPAYVSGVEFVFLESYPVQVRATISGDLPTPCHELGWRLGEADESGRLVLEVWSHLPDPDAVCAQVLEPFEETIDLGSFETGDYVLEIDGTDYPFTI